MFDGTIQLDDFDSGVNHSGISDGGVLGWLCSYAVAGNASVDGRIEAKP